MSHGHHAADGPLVLSGDLDVTAPAARPASPGTRTWRILAICADARSNIESDIVHGLGQAQGQLRLAGLTYCLLYGTAVVFVLAHEPDGITGAGRDIEAQLQRALGHSKLRVLVDRDLTTAGLGPAGSYPMLRVHFRWRDRPGAMRDVLAALTVALGEALPGVGADDWSVSYARTQVAAGRSAQARLTVRVHDDAAGLASWTPARLEELSQRVQVLAAHEAATAGPGGQAAGDEPDDPVVSVELIRAPGPA
jgi:hypothetical protein